MKRRYLPALLGHFGDWKYFTCSMPLAELARRVSFATELRRSEQLSQLIQRKLKTKRAVEIANYLTSRPDRFFNSLVIAFYGGDPEWHEFGNITPTANSDIELSELPDESLYSVGFLSFSGQEKLFAIDGQHRLAGMKEVTKREDGKDLTGDDVPVIFVAHKNSSAGLARTRRLFTTLNKTARPVSKGEIIALDEDDVMAITVRRLVEEHAFFRGRRISYNATTNLLPGDMTALTTIGNLYDVLAILFSKAKKKTPLEKLRFNRPSDAELDDYFGYAVTFFEELAARFRPLGQYFRSRDESRIVVRNRGHFGGHVLFRPVGLRMLTEVVVALAPDSSLKAAIARCSTLPQQLSDIPYNGLVWDGVHKRMAASRAALNRDILLYMVGAKPPSAKLKKRYAEALGEPDREDQLFRKLQVEGRKLART